MAKGYTAKDIDVLEGLEPVRKRPGMFIGSTDKEHADSVRRKFASDSVFPYYARPASGCITIIFPTLVNNANVSVRGGFLIWNDSIQFPYLQRRSVVLVTDTDGEGRRFFELLFHGLSSTGN